jgi:plastocyanin
MKKFLILVSLVVVLTGCGQGSQSTVGLAKPAGTGTGSPGAAAQTFTVTAPRAPDNFTINGADGPALTLQRGKSYNFVLAVPGHPFYIMTIDSPNPANAFTKGVTGNGTSTGTLVFTVPADAPNTLSYNCSVHAAMSGTITVTN